jgi:hypothetical protein
MSGRQSRLTLSIIVCGLAVIAVCLIFLLKLHLYREKSSPPSVTLSNFQNPIAGLRFDIRRMDDLIEKHPELQNEQDDLVDIIKKLKKLGITTLDVFMFPDKEHTVLPVVALRGNQEVTLTRLLLSDDSPLAPYVEKIAEDLYRFRREAFPEEDWADFPVDIYRLRLINGDCFIVPEPLFESLPAGYDLIAQSPVAQFANTVIENDGVAELAIRFPVNFTAGWQKKINENPLYREQPLVKMMTDMVMSWFQQLVAPFEQLQYMALGLRINGESRYLRYAQLFQPAIDGSVVYENLINKKADTGFGIIGSIMELLEDPLLSVDLDFKENLLAFNVAWESANDQPVIKAIAEATIGVFFQRAMLSGEATQESITATYTSAPRLTRQVDVSQLKNSLPDLISMNLFPDSFWPNREEPTMNITMDPVTIPNAVLATAEYEVLRINTPDGRDVHRPTEESFFTHSVQFDNEHQSRIKLDVVAGTRAEELSTAVVRFRVSLPTELCFFDFTTGTSDKTRKKGGFLVFAERIEKDIAEIYSQGSKAIWLFAYDKTGKAISARESISSSANMFKRFSGVIDRLQVVVAGEIIEQTIDVEVDLNRGQKIELTHTPQIPPRTRLEYSPAEEYFALSVEELADLQVEWVEDDTMLWATAGLKIRLPNGPVSTHTRWETYFYGEDGEQFIRGTPYSSGTDIGYRIDSDKLSKAHAAFGKVTIAVAGKIEKLQFNYQGEQTFGEQYLSNGEAIKLAFNQNEIAYQKGSSEVIHIHAFDSQNRHLKEDNYSKNTKGTTSQYFWGIPVRVEMEVATDFHERTFSFDLQARPVDSNAYEGFKQEINHSRNIANTLKNLFQTRYQNSRAYGEDLAGLFYLAGKASGSTIDKAVAFSDPKGESRFGYRALAYEGYHFTVLPSSQKFLLRMEEMSKTSGINYTYGDQSYKVLPVQNLPALAAIPVDKSRPTFFVNRNGMYMKKLNGELLSHVPDNYYNSGWKRVKLIE